MKPDHIEVTTVKTADSLIIELNDHSKAILEKYKDVHFENHMALPVISNQKMNDYLKELGELAEINEPVRELSLIHISGKEDGAENVIRVKATTEGFPGETNFSVICEDGSFFSFNAKYAREPEMLNIEMKDFLENEDTSDFSHTRMNIYFRELAGESPLLVKLIMQSIYKNNDRKVRHLGSKRFGIQFLIKGIYTYNGMLYVHTQTKNSSNVPFDTDFIKFKIVDKKVPKRTAIQETVLDAVRSYNEVIEIAGKSTVRTVYALPKFTIPDDKLLLVELYEKDGGRHQTIRVENSDIVNAEMINELKIK